MQRRRSTISMAMSFSSCIRSGHLSEENWALSMWNSRNLSCPSPWSLLSYSIVKQPRLSI